MRILKALAHRPCFAAELADMLGVSPATISYHVKILRDARLVSAVDACGVTQLELEIEQVLASIDDVRDLLAE